MVRLCLVPNRSGFLSTELPFFNRGGLSREEPRALGDCNTAAVPVPRHRYQTCILFFTPTSLATNYKRNLQDTPVFDKLEYL